jgi:HK97 family phage major capsid protein
MRPGHGADSPGEIVGILNRQGLSPDVVAGGSPSAPDADAIKQQAVAIEVATGLAADRVVIHPSNWQTIQLMKDESDAYIGASPFASPVTPQLWGLNVAVTAAIEEGTALVGAFAQAAQIFRKGGVRVQVTNAHSDYFIKNKVAIRAEERLALAVYRPAAFGKVTGLSSS